MSKRPEVLVIQSLEGYPEPWAECIDMEKVSPNALNPGAWPEQIYGGLVWVYTGERIAHLPLQRPVVDSLVAMLENAMFPKKEE